MHVRFWKILKAEAPEVYRKYTGYSFLAPGGFRWVEYALSRGYKELHNEKISRAGESLCKAYLGFTSAFGSFISVLVLAGVIGIVWYAFRATT